MKKTLLPIALVALCALTACQGGTKVSNEEFQKKAAAVEEHQYDKATLTVKTSVKTVALDEEDFQAQMESGSKEIKLKNKTTEEKVEYTAEYTYDKENEVWVTDSEEAAESEDESAAYIGMSVKTVALSYDETQIPEGYTVTYYVNPFKIVAKIDITSSEIVPMTMKGSGTIEFEKNGCVSKVTSEMNIEIVMDYAAMLAAMELAGYKFDTSAVGNMTTVMKGTATISYK